jgi:hypothetical protein
MIEYLVKRPVGRPPHEVRRYSASFQLKRAELEETRRAVAKVEWHPGELNPGVGFILTTRTRPVECLGDSLRGCCRRFPVDRYGQLSGLEIQWRAGLSGGTRPTATPFRSLGACTRLRSLARPVRAPCRGERRCDRLDPLPSEEVIV